MLVTFISILNSAMGLHQRNKRVLFNISILVLMLGSLVLTYALSNEYTGHFSPSDYITVTLERAQAELEELQGALRNASLTPREFLNKVHRISSRNKRVKQNRNTPEANDEHVIDITGLELPGTQNK